MAGTVMPHTRSGHSSGSAPDSATVRDGLEVYLDHAGKYARLNAVEERAELVALARLRAERWHALLSCPTMALAILAWLEAEKNPKLPGAAMRRVRSAITGGDDDATDAVREALDEFIFCMAKVDAGKSDRICVEVRRLAAGEPSTLARPDGDAFDAYVRRVSARDTAYTSARNRFLCANLRLVVNVAGRYANNWMPLADRVQEGNLGLLAGVDRFDVERGTRFSTYAVWWIRHFITRALIKRGRKIRIPAHLHRVFMKARAAQPLLRCRLGREPTPDELAAEIDVDVARLCDAREAMTLRGVGLDAPLDPDGRRTVADALEAPPLLDLDRTIDDERCIARARIALGELDERHYDILRRRFGLDGETPWTLRKLGDRYALSRERIRQLQNKALMRLRESIVSVEQLASA
jgi:RNA polymerase primary sigma factor